MKVSAKLFVGQVIKEYSGRRLKSACTRIVQGTKSTVDRLLESTKTGRKVNTSYIERLNATFRSRLAMLVRRGRALAHTERMLQAGMYLVGVSYNFCSVHATLSSSPVSSPVSSSVCSPPLPSTVASPLRRTRKGQRPTTPAMAAGVTDHVWGMEELMRYAVPPPRWQLPRGFSTRRRIKPRSRDIPDEFELSDHEHR